MNNEIRYILTKRLYFLEQLNEELPICERNKRASESNREETIHIIKKALRQQTEKRD